MTPDYMTVLLEKIDEIRVDIGEIKVTQARQAGALETHIRRTELAEAAIAHVQARVVPIEAHVAQMAGAWKLVTALALLIGTAAAAVRFL